MKLPDDSIRRRCWLLQKALEALPFAESLQLARAAEAFLTTPPIETAAHDAGTEAPISAPVGDVSAMAYANGNSPETPFPAQTRQIDPPATLVAESRGDEFAVFTPCASVLSATVDEIVCYLRRQDDIVVPERDGRFLVNGRFREDLAQLTARANRIRSRRQQAPFVMISQ
jgi:hypothetical protein